MKRKPQSEHKNALILLCDAMCDFKLNLRVKQRWHMLHVGYAFFTAGTCCLGRNGRPGDPMGRFFEGFNDALGLSSLESESLKLGLKSFCGESSCSSHNFSCFCGRSRQESAGRKVICVIDVLCICVSDSAAICSSSEWVKLLRKNFEGGDTGVSGVAESTLRLSRGFNSKRPSISANVFCSLFDFIIIQSSQMDHLFGLRLFFSLRCKSQMEAFRSS